MSPEPRHRSDYGARQVEAAHRVLVDLVQVLAAFQDAMVIVGGWVPDLLLPHAVPEHVGSIDVDLGLDTGKLGEGRYAELLNLLVDTHRYEQGEKEFQVTAKVDLEDGEPPVSVEVEFLAPSDVKLKKQRPKLVEGFRVLQFPACAAAFEDPQDIEIEGSMISGAANRVRVRVASLSDFIIMKAHALEGRDKPKDAYDLCYCLEEYPGGLVALAQNWRSRQSDRPVQAAIRIFREKFASVDRYGPQQLADFHDPADADEHAMHGNHAGFVENQYLVAKQRLDSLVLQQTPADR